MPAALNEIVWTATAEMAPPDRVRVMFLVPSGCRLYKWLICTGRRTATPDAERDAARLATAGEFTEADPPLPNWWGDDDTVARADSEVRYWAFLPETAPDGGSIGC